MPRPAIFLFDIDGTLISSGGAGRRAVEAAFTTHHGRADACAGFSFAGMTDRAIARRALAGLGVVDGTGEMASEIEGAIDRVLATYLRLLEEEVRGAADYRVHRGIDQTLCALEGDAAGGARLAIGLGTGNLEAGARLKLARADLDRRFSFGGFGSDAEDRAELLRVGAERGAGRLGRERSACRVVIIGDTPRDIHAAHAIGAEAIAVATGPFSVADLAAAGADHAFADLEAEGALDAVRGALLR